MYTLKARLVPALLVPATVVAMFVGPTAAAATASGARTTVQVQTNSLGGGTKGETEPTRSTSVTPTGTTLVGA